MAKKLLLYFILFTGLVVSSAFIFEEGKMDLLLYALKRQTESLPQEKVHLQLDRVHYVQGDEIWLKAYIVNAERNEPTALSKVLYVDLIDQDKIIKERLTLPIKEGKANGSFTIPDVLPSGTYRIRAYTTYMRNFDDAFFFEKAILIGNAGQAQQVDGQVVEAADLQFFPEGGALVNEVESVVGFKAIGIDGLGKEASGYIVDNTQNKVAEFETE
ncbi:MAG: hypothetical protein EOO03_16975, partial [Chitinophagaceae bacterium]